MVEGAERAAAPGAGVVDRGGQGHARLNASMHMPCLFRCSPSATNNRLMP